MVRSPYLVRVRVRVGVRVGVGVEVRAGARVRVRAWLVVRSPYYDHVRAPRDIEEI